MGGWPKACQILDYTLDLLLSYWLLWIKSHRRSLPLSTWPGQQGGGVCFGWEDDWRRHGFEFSQSLLSPSAKYFSNAQHLSSLSTYWPGLRKDRRGDGFLLGAQQNLRGHNDLVWKKYPQARWLFPAQVQTHDRPLGWSRCLCSTCRGLLGHPLQTSVLIDTQSVVLASFCARMSIQDALGGRPWPFDLLDRMTQLAIWRGGDLVASAGLSRIERDLFRHHVLKPHFLLLCLTSSALLLLAIHALKSPESQGNSERRGPWSPPDHVVCPLGLVAPPPSHLSTR